MVGAASVLCARCASVDRRLSAYVLGFIRRMHNIVDGYRVPCHNIIMLYWIDRLSLSYYTLDTASHNILMDTKEVFARRGTMCACVDALWVHGKSKFTVCINCSVSLPLLCA